MSTTIQAIQNAEAAKREALSKLHIELGFDSPQALTEAITAAVGTTPKTSSKPAPNGNSRKGRKVPQATLDAIKAALQAGEVGSSLPAKFGVSYNIVHAVKTKMGLVTPTKRSKKKKG